MESDFYKKYGKCPDDQIIYEVYESQAACCAWEMALEVHRKMEGSTGKRK